MRPKANWTHAAPEVAKFLRAHGVRFKRVLSDDRTFWVFLVPDWALKFYTRHLDVSDFYSPDRGLMRRTLQRAARDADFRAALEAATAVGLERSFLAQQEQKTEESN